MSSSDLHPQWSMLVVWGAAGQQVRRGGSWGGVPPDVQGLPLWARRQPLAQVAGARTGRGRQSTLAAVQAAGVVVSWAFARVSRGADVGGAVVVGSPAGAFALMTLAPQDANESQLELPIVAGVDDGVQAAVEVAQPEDDFKEDFRWAQVHIKGPWRKESGETLI